MGSVPIAEERGTCTRTCACPQARGPVASALVHHRKAVLRRACCGRRQIGTPFLPSLLVQATSQACLPTQVRHRSRTCQRAPILESFARADLFVFASRKRRKTSD